MKSSPSSRTRATSASELEREARIREGYADRLAGALYETRATSLRPPPTQTVAEWADTERRLSPESSAEPGQWRTSRAPWTRAPMDAASDPEVREITAVFASQTAKTEIINNVVGYLIHRDPCPMLAVFASDRMGTTWSKDRLAPMLRDSPALRGLVFDRLNARKGSGTSEILEKKFPGGLLAITGANSAAGLAMRPVRVVFGDEIDRFPASAGGGGGKEGDPISLAQKRTSNFDDALHVWSSSPGEKSRSRVWKKYLQSDRNRWWVPCPHCDAEQTLRWEQVDFRDGELSQAELDALSNEERAARARYVCEHCGVLWSEQDRRDASAAGRWVADAPELTARRGFWINGLASPWLTLAELVEEWLEAQGDPLLLQAFVNTRLAELWDDGAERIPPDVLLERLEKYPALVPVGVLLITAGVDVQRAPARLEVTRYGWGISGECWAIDHHVLSGDPATLLEAKEDKRLDDLLVSATFTRQDGAPMRVAAACIDSNGGFYEEVLKYAKERRGRNVFAIQGRAGGSVPLWPLRATRVKRARVGRADLYGIGVDVAKTALAHHLKRERPEGYKPGDAVPGLIHFPTRPEFDVEFFAQLTADVLRPGRRKGRLFVEWIQEYPRAEALDCFVYARAAVAALSPNWAALAALRKREAKKSRRKPTPGDADADTDADLELEADEDLAPEEPAPSDSVLPRLTSDKRGRKRRGYVQRYR